jgi:hypothetical protein
MNFGMIDDPRQWIQHILPTLDRSPLYRHLASGMAVDPETAALLNFIDNDQPKLILFFTVVNFLVFKHSDHPFAQFYPRFSAQPRESGDVYPSFKDFCRTYRADLEFLMPRRRLQTNEVSRCANLLPAFSLVYERGGSKPLSMIEIGASAGLNLNWYYYDYIYQGTFHVGNDASPVQIHCSLPEHHFPALRGIPEVASCQGIDLSPPNINSHKDVLWLAAHVWPEEKRRYDLLDAAIKFTRLHPPRLYEGDATQLLPNLLAAIPLDHTPCIWHSFALNQGPAEVKARIECQLLNASKDRTVYRVSLEVDPKRQAPPRLEVTTYQKGALLNEVLAECAYHGESMIWLAPA